MKIIFEIVQIDLSLLITNWESDTLIGTYDHDFFSDDCHPIYYFPISTSNDSLFTSFDLYGLTFNYPGTCQEVKALPHSLMVI